WWHTTPRLGLRLRARPRPAGLAGPTPGGIGLAGLCDYDYEVAVGDSTLSLQELQQLAEAKAPLVRLKGRWVELRAGDVERGLAWLWFLQRYGLGACLADDMGLGKTAQLLALMVAEREGGDTGARPGATLLVCPMSLVGNWQRETERFAPGLAVHVHHGA